MVKIANWLIIICFVFASGCITGDILEFATPEGAPSDIEASDGYCQLELNQSNTADTLSVIHLPDHETLSQSKNVIASSGQKKRNNYKQWFKLASFDEDSLILNHKYYFLCDERPKVLFCEPWPGFCFDSQTTLSVALLDKPFANNNAKRIAVLRFVLSQFRKDIGTVRADNKNLNICSMMVNQAFEGLLVNLKESPSSAGKIDDSNGFELSHINMDTCKVQLTIDDNIATVKMRTGSYTKWRIGLSVYKFSDDRSNTCYRKDSDQ